MARILEALRELDPSLDIRAMPGTKEDLHTLCKALDDPARNFHRISLRTFGNDIKGWLAFEHGRKPGEIRYYHDRLEALASKLA